MSLAHRFFCGCCFALKEMIQFKKSVISMRGMSEKSSAICNLGAVFRRKFLLALTYNQFPRWLVEVTFLFNIIHWEEFLQITAIKPKFFVSQPLSPVFYLKPYPSTSMMVFQ